MVAKSSEQAVGLAGGARLDEKRQRGALTTGDMARLSSSTLRTVRFYEEQRLLEPMQRSDGGHRLFAESELDKLHYITELRTAGLSIQEIREVLSVKRGAQNGAAAAHQLCERLSKQIESVTERVATMQRLLAELEEARRTLHECRECADPALFPDSCSDCQVIKARSELPNSLRVLWGVHR